MKSPLNEEHSFISDSYWWSSLTHF